MLASLLLTKLACCLKLGVQNTWHWQSGALPTKLSYMLETFTSIFFLHIACLMGQEQGQKKSDQRSEQTHNGDVLFNLSKGLPWKRCPGLFSLILISEPISSGDTWRSKEEWTPNAQTRLGKDRESKQKCPVFYHIKRLVRAATVVFSCIN